MTTWTWTGAASLSSTINYGNNAVAGDWSTAGNWSANVVPTLANGDAVTLTPVLLPSSLYADEALYSGDFTVDATITLADMSTADFGFTLGLMGSTTFSGGGTFILQASNVSDQTYSAILNASGLAASAAILTNVNDTIEGAGVIGGTTGGRSLMDLVNETGGVIDATSASVPLILQSPAITNSGLIEATGAGGLEFSGGNVVDQSGGGTLLADGGDIYLSTYTHAGATIIGGTMTSENGGEFLAPEGFTLDGTGALPVTITAGTDIVTGLPAPAGNTYEGGLILAASSGQTSSIVNQGTLTLTTTIQGNATLEIGPASGAGGVVDLSGGGTVDFVYQTGIAGNFNTIFGTGTLVNADNVIEGIQGQIAGSINNETAGKVEVAGATLVTSMVNSGLVEATGAGGFTVKATIDQSGGGTLLASGGDVTLSGNNNNADIIGGTLTGQNGFGFVTGGAGGTASLDGTVAGGLTISAHTTLSDTGANPIDLIAANGQTASIDNQGSIDASGGSRFAPNVFIGSGNGGGAATVKLSGGGNVSLSGGWIANGLGGGKATLENVDNTIEGSGVIWGQDAEQNLYLVNDAAGLIDANISGQTLQLDTGNAVANSGTLEADAGTLLVSDAVSGSGSAKITDGGSLTFSSTFNQNVVFSGSGGTLNLSSRYSGVISGFSGSDVIKLTPLSGDDTIIHNVAAHSITIEGGATPETIQFSANTSVQSMQLSDVGGVDTLTYCFMAGTRIRTPDGEAAIETLKPGDLVLTHDGLVKPVNWLGRQTVSRAFAHPLRQLPIRIRAGALAENVPCRDLLVSPDHALLVGDALIHAGALVNGSSIVRETRVPEAFVYYHVELDDHSLILAENTPAETFVDNADRMNFDNWAEFEALYPDGKTVDELPYPRAKAHRQVPVHIRMALADRSAPRRAADTQVA